MYYTHFFDHATRHFFYEIGITPGYLKNENKGMVLAEQKINYLREIHSGDLIHVTSNLQQVKNKAVLFEHRMFNTDMNEEVAVCELVGIHIDNSTRKSCPFPLGLVKS